ncbi:MAG: DUF3048 domain-containing protein [Actinomycetota bacterium]
MSGKFTATLVGVLLMAAAAAGYLFFVGNPQAGRAERAEAPPICPLTNEEGSSRRVARRPALAVKIENIPESRPQSGLAQADVIYEQPVEGGITRFIAVYQCADSDRIGPIRSARLVDAEVLPQFGVPLFAYSGGAGPVLEAISEASLVDASPANAGDAYVHDSARAAPHDLYASTGALFQTGRREGTTPESVFTFSNRLENRKAFDRSPQINVNYSPAANVFWSWDRASKRWLRSHDGIAHTLEDGTQVSVDNVIVQMVQVSDSGIVDAAGNPSPEVDVLGQGTAYIFRDGRVIEGTWVRDAVTDVTRFVDAQGNEIALTPGRTWIHLFPSDAALTF